MRRPFLGVALFCTCGVVAATSVSATPKQSAQSGHADIVRELIDGLAGLRRDSTNLPSDDRAWWDDYRARLEQVARTAGRS